MHEKFGTHDLLSLP